MIKNKTPNKISLSKKSLNKAKTKTKQVYNDLINQDRVSFDYLSLDNKPLKLIFNRFQFKIVDRFKNKETIITRLEAKNLLYFHYQTELMNIKLNEKTYKRLSKSNHFKNHKKTLIKAFVG